MKTANLKLYSQYLDFTNKERQKHGCGIASLAMLMDYINHLSHTNKNIPSLDKLYQVGINRRAYIKGVGWRHSGLVGLAKIYGFKKSQAYDLSRFSDVEALRILKQKLKQGPVLASIYSKYKTAGNGHLIGLLSVTKQEVVVLDPDSKTKQQVLRHLPVAKFIRAWKKRFIAIRL